MEYFYYQNLLTQNAQLNKGECSVQRLKVNIAYDGTGFAGFQVQVKKRTIQLEIEKALEKIHRQPVRIFASGRTDSGVHARSQFIHFDTELELSEQNWENALRTTFPDDITVKNVEKVSSDFHARKNARDKTYRYFIRNTSAIDIFMRNFEWHVPQKLDIQKMKEAALQIEGTHDFTPFSASKSNVKGDKTRTVHHIQLFEEDGRLMVEVKGNGFLTHMVRIIVGTLVDIGLGKKDLDCIEKAFQSKDRRLLGRTSPGKGLFLWEVTY